MNRFSDGYHGSWARTHDGGVAQDGGHTPANRLTGTCSLGLKRPSLISEIRVKVN